MDTANFKVDVHAHQLARDGVIIIENYLNPSQCDNLRGKIEEVVQSGQLKMDKGELDYRELASADESIISRRSGDRDAGMLDIFNMQLVIPELTEIKEDPHIEHIINQSTGAGYESENLNIYLNRSVKGTRDYHADTYSGKFKAFVYLTDVPDESYGPFSYVKQSQAPGRLKRKATAFVNRLRGLPHTNAVFYDRSNIVTCTAPRGTLIIANQAGLHRGMPQEQGKERMLISLSYTPVQS